MALVAGGGERGAGGLGRPAILLNDAMARHAVMQGADRVAYPGQACPWEETVHETGERANQHAAAKAEGHSHVLEVGLVDRGRVIGEAAKHLVILAVRPGNGLLPLRRMAQS